MVSIIGCSNELRVRRGVQIQEAGQMGARVVQASMNVTVSATVATIVHRAAINTPKSPILSKITTCMEFIPGISIPFALRAIWKATKGLVKGKNKVDSALRKMEGWAWLIDSTYTLFNGLHLSGAVGLTAVKIAASASVASSFLWLATIALSVKHIKESNQLLNSFKKCTDRNVFVQIGTMKNRDLTKYFNVNAQALTGALAKIATKLSSDIPEGEKVKIYDGANKILKNRIKDKNFSHKLTILSSTITFVAMLVLAFTPLAPLAYLFLTVSAVITLAKVIREYRASSKFFNDLARI